MNFPQLVQLILTFIRKVILPYKYATKNVIEEIKTENPPPVTPQEPATEVLPPEPTPPTSPVDIEHSDVMYPKWDTKQHIRHNMRVIADEMGLSVLQKDLLCDVCACESGFNLKAKLVNNPKSIDRGLFQINSYYHKEATDEKAYDPEWSTRWACKAILRGEAHSLWSASQPCWNKTGKYNSLLK